jgi:murein L,D-transpeptidase YcbB/YkuD
VLCGWLTAVTGAQAPSAGLAAAPETRIRALLAAFEAPAADPWDVARWRAPVLALYATRGYLPLWLDGRALTRPALAVLGELRAAPTFGLRALDYDADRLLAEAGILAADPAHAPRDATELDLAITIAAARFVTDLHSGRVSPQDVGDFLEVPHGTMDVAAALGALATTNDVPGTLRRYEPPFRHYELLKRSLARYRTLATDPTLTQLPAMPRRSVKAGEPYAGAAALARLLAALGDLDAAATPPQPGANGTLDAALSSGLARFQTRHGLAPDGALGAATWAALTTPLDRRIRQIELSLERLRWLPPKLPTPPIIVNIPQFRLFAFSGLEDDEKSMLAMDVIVGRTFRPAHTPVFAADMKFVVFRPFWDVPASIVRNELLPKMRASASWADRNGFELVRGQGDDAVAVPVTPENLAALERGTLRVRQKPGAENSLGLVKFMLPNRYNVYLHSTPAQSLFRQSQRAFSHGCIRVADPVALARFVLRDDPAWTQERILEAMQTPRPPGALPLRVYLKAPLRVFILYATAIGSEDGRTLFFGDLYGHDAKLDALLAARRPLPAPHRT